MEKMAMAVEDLLTLGPESESTCATLQDGIGTSAECGNMAEPGKKYCSTHRARNLMRHIVAVPPGVFIIEELVARGMNLDDLAAALPGPSALLGILDGRISVLPVARFLARFFGTSVTLWKNIGCQWDKRAKNGQETVSQSDQTGAPA